MCQGYRRRSVWMFPVLTGNASLSFTTLELVVFHATGALAAFVHPNRIVIYAQGILSLAAFLQREILRVSRDYLAITLRPR